MVEIFKSGDGLPGRVDSPPAGNRMQTRSAVPANAREKCTVNSLTTKDAFRDWDPVRELEELQNRLGSFFRRSSLRQGRDEMEATEWSPLVDILEDDQEFLIKVDLPEVRREDVR